MSFVLTLKLKTEIYHEHKINKSFNVAVRIYNSLLSHEIKKLKALNNNQEYKDLLYKKGKSKEDYQILNKFRKDYNISEFDFINDIKDIRNNYKNNMSSQVAQKLAKRLYKSFEKYFYSNGNKIRYKRKDTIDSLEGASNYNGIIFDGKNVKYLDIVIPVIIKNNPYINEALKNKVSYCRILRKVSKRGYNYYVQLTLNGASPSKVKTKSNGRVGIDIGTSTIALVSDNKVSISELSKDIKTYNKELRRIDRKIERSKRTLNPNNYNDDKTLKKGKHKWIISNKCKRLFHKRSYIYQTIINKRKYSYELLSNEILSLGNKIILEDMNYKSLQERKKETTKDSQGRYESKRRYGRSLLKHAPSTLISILERKAYKYDAEVIKVDRYKYRASQYNHITGEFTKHDLNERIYMIGDYEIQRDLYSAFLLKCYKTKDEIDNELCLKEFEGFKDLHDNEIKRLKKQRNISCIGY